MIFEGSLEDLLSDPLDFVVSFYPGWGCTFVVFFFGLGMENVVIGVGQSKFTATKSGPNSPPQISTPIFLAQRRAPKSTLLGTRESNKKHDDLEHDFLQEGEHQKSQFARRSSEGEHQKARFLGRRRAPKSRQRRAFHKGEHQKAQFLARRKAPKSTI